MTIAILQTLLAAAACYGLWRFWRALEHHGRASQIITAGFVVRALGAQLLFWISWLRLPVARSLQLGDGFWFFALDGQWYLEYARDLLGRGAKAIFFISATYASRIFTQWFTVFAGAFGVVASTGILFNCFFYLVACALILRLGKGSGRLVRSGAAPAALPRGRADETSAPLFSDDLFERADVLIGQPARGFRKRRRGQKIVYDMFDPTVLELRELYGAAPSVRQRVHLAAEWTRLQFALAHADLLIAAAPQQRAFYSQLQWRDVPWIDVPFGIDMSEVKSCPPARDNIVVWGGGVWEWLDPKTAIDAIVRLNRDGLRCRLLFLGRARPNQEVVERRREDRFSALLEAGAPYVDANPEWVPYRERLSWLRGGKAAIMLHRPTPEANFAIRTRLFDAIAAGVPVVATERGFAAELVEREGLGVVVPPQDVPAVAGAIRRLFTDDEFHARCVTNLERIRPAFAWEAVTRPLVDAVTQWQKQAH